MKQSRRGQYERLSTITMIREIVCKGQTGGSDQFIVYVTDFWINRIDNQLNNHQKWLLLNGFSGFKYDKKVKWCIWPLYGFDFVYPWQLSYASKPG